LTFDLVGIGNPVYDSIITPSTKTEGRVLSGCSTNACLVAKKLGLRRVGLIGSIGPDFGSKFLGDMARFGIEVPLKSLSGATGGFRLIYDSTGDRTLDVIGVADPIRASDIPETYLDAKFIMIGPILGEVDYRLIQHLRDSSHARLFLDPQGLVRIIGKDGRVTHACEREEFDRIARIVDYIKPNEHESETITREHDPLRAARLLGQMSAAIPIVTLAERGSIIMKDGRLYRIPAFSTNAIDPTGAGDVYAGSFITRILENSDEIDAALFASAAASVMVEQVGPEFTMPRDVVEKRKEEISKRLVVETVS
jgi:sugar/nucleoside kinase (ribokinase family)